MSISNTRTREVAMTYPARPPKRPPAHPGEVLADILDQQRASLRGAAAAIGMSPTGLNKVLLGRSPVTPDTALRLGTWLGNGPELWLNLQQGYDLWHARARLQAALGKIKPIKDAA